MQTAKPSTNVIIWAQVLNTQANLEHRIGKTETALATWQQAQKYYKRAGDKIGSLGSQINQAQALQSLGFYRRSRQQLEEITQKLAAMPDSDVKVSGLRSLGMALHASGDSKSQEVLEQSLVIAIKLPADAPALAVGKNYQWFLALKIDGQLNQSTPYVDGWIQRIQPGTKNLKYLMSLLFLDRELFPVHFCALLVYLLCDKNLRLSENLLGLLAYFPNSNKHDLG